MSGVHFQVGKKTRRPEVSEKGGKVRGQKGGGGKTLSDPPPNLPGEFEYIDNITQSFAFEKPKPNYILKYPTSI